MNSLRPQSRIHRILAPFALTLALACLTITPAAAQGGNAYSDAFIDGMLLMWAEQCTQQGGQAQVHMDFSTDGHLNSAYVRCSGASPL